MTRIKKRIYFQNCCSKLCSVFRRGKGKKINDIVILGRASSLKCRMYGMCARKIETRMTRNVSTEAHNKHIKYEENQL